MPTIDEQLRDRIRGSAPRLTDTKDLVPRLTARKQRRGTVRKISTVALVMAVLLGTAGSFFALGRAFRTSPLPAATPSQPVENLGLDFPVCHVMSMPITIGGSAGSAYVFTKEDTNCPDRGEGDRFVAADLTGDGVVDTSPIQLRGCFPPIGCEAFAAPDVNGDGTSEIAVSNAGADGYGISLFALTTSPPTITPVQVENPDGIGGSVPAGPLEFAWVDVATHFLGAYCETDGEGTTSFVLVSGDKLGEEADLRSTALLLEGTVARVIDAGQGTEPLATAPTPKDHLCGAPVSGTASSFPAADAPS